MSAWLGPTVWMLPMVYVTRSRVTVVTVVTVAAWITVSPVLAGGLLLTMLCNHPLSTLHSPQRIDTREAGWSPGTSGHQPPVTSLDTSSSPRCCCGQIPRHAERNDDFTIIVSIALALMLWFGTWIDIVLKIDKNRGKNYTHTSTILVLYYYLYIDRVLTTFSISNYFHLDT